MSINSPCELPGEYQGLCISLRCSPTYHKWDFWVKFWPNLYWQRHKMVLSSLYSCLSMNLCRTTSWSLFVWGEWWLVFGMYSMSFWLTSKQVLSTSCWLLSGNSDSVKKLLFKVQVFWVVMPCWQVNSFSTKTNLRQNLVHKMQSQFTTCYFIVMQIVT
jgi:hypothetical protein